MTKWLVWPIVVLLSGAAAAWGRVDINTLWQPQEGMRRRASSFNRTGGNRDFLSVRPAQEVEFLTLEGTSGCIRRLWMTIACDDPREVAIDLMSSFLMTHLLRVIPEKQLRSRLMGSPGKKCVRRRLRDGAPSPGTSAEEVLKHLFQTAAHKKCVLAQ